MDSLVSDRPAPSAQRRQLRAVWVLLAIATAVVIVVVGVATLFWPRTTVVMVLRQPADVVYADTAPHYAVLRHTRAPIAAAELGPGANHYDLVLGRDPQGSYGHYIRIDVSGLDPRQLTVEWKPEGAWVNSPTGHRLFVPAKSFIFGR